VWGKPAKRGLYWAFKREITAAEISEISYKIFPETFLSPSQQNNPANLLYGPATSGHVQPSKYSLCTGTLLAGWYGLCTASGWLSRFGPDSASSLVKEPWNRPLDGCCIWPEFGLPLLHSTAQVWPLLAAQIWPRTRPLCLSCSLFFSCPSTLFSSLAQIHK
jgi:hypothetical protein